MFDTLIDIVFFNLYGSLITVVTLLAAIPYAIWQGLRKLKNRIGGALNGNARTGR
jgi:hypothetical protein